MITPFLGEVVLYAFQFAPQGWANCAGQLLPISQNPALMELIGIKFGGNGTTDFALPDYRGIAPQGMRYCIALQGVFPGKGSRPQGVGEIAILPFDFAPETWTDCAGQLLQVSENEALFKVLGTTFGGDGQSTFGLPDLTKTPPPAPPSSGPEGSSPANSLYFISGAGGSAPAEPLLAEVRLFPFNAAPEGWLICEGQLLPINQNQALFSLLGTTFGGNGINDFALPDLRRSEIPAGTHYCIAVNITEAGFPQRSLQAEETEENVPAEESAYSSNNEEA